MRIIKSTLNIIKNTLNPFMIEKGLDESHVPAAVTADKPSCSLYVNMRSSLKAVPKKARESMAESDGQFLLYQETLQSLKPIVKMTITSAPVASESPYQRSALKPVPKTTSSLIVEDNSNALFETYVSMRQNLKPLTSAVPSLIELLKKDYMSHCEIYASSRLNLKAVLVDSTKRAQESISNGLSDLYIATRQKLKPLSSAVPSLVDLLKNDYMSHSWLYASARQNLKAVNSKKPVQETLNNGLSDIYIATRQNLKPLPSAAVPSLVALLKKDYMSHSELYTTARLNLKAFTSKLDANMEKDDSIGLSDLYLAARQNLKPIDKTAADSMADATVAQADAKLYLSTRQSLKAIRTPVELQASTDLLGQESSENLTLVL